LFDHLSAFHFRLLSLFVASAMGRRAKNKQGDPLPLHADPDLNGSSTAPKLKSKFGPKEKFSAQNLNANLGKRKLERDDDGERATKKPKGARPDGKPILRAKATSAKKPAAKAKSKPVKPNRKNVDFRESEVMDDDNGVEDVDMQAAARCVCLSEDVDASPN